MFLALLFRVSVDEIRFIKFFIISFTRTVIFERFFLRVREPREEKRREEKREKRVCSRGREDLKKKEKKKSGKRKDNRSPLVCLSLLSSQKVLKSQNNKNLFSFCFPPNNKNRTDHTHKKLKTQHTNENETTYDANRRCRRR